LAARQPAPRRIGLTALQSAPQRIGLAALAWCLQMGTAMAFPMADQTNPSIVPGNNDLPTPDLLDLEHQMGLASGFASLGSQQGWTILPRITAEEALTDNVFEVGAPRRWDLTTIISPGVTVLGNSDRAQLRLDYQPNLEMHLINGSQNSLTQQLNAVGNVTVVPELVFIDARALAGVETTNGGIGGLGGLGQPGVGGVTGTTLGQGQTTDAALSKLNRTQVASGSISPYMLYQFGDVGTAKIGVSLSESSSSPVSGFAPVPLVSSSGTNNEQESTVEEFAQFQTGDQSSVLRDTVRADGMQSTSSGIGFSSSSRDTISNRVDYQIDRTVDVYGDIGWEDISYSGGNSLRINDLTWGFGTVLTPNPDDTISIGYGHLNGANTLTASARYLLTERTVLTASYDNGVGSQLEQINNQLAQSSVGNNGGLVNSGTGGQQFVGNNALGVSSGIFRYSYLTLGATTTRDRDIFGLTIGYSKQTQIGSGGSGSTNAATVATVNWTHELSTNLVASGIASASIGNPSTNGAAGGASSKTFVVTASLQYIISDTVSTFARYSFYDVQSTTAGQSWYQDLFLVGITKQF
jgi:uncharacterized protein (PEP-CTERM system associated)